MSRFALLRAIGLAAVALAMAGCRSPRTCPVAGALPRLCVRQDKAGRGEFFNTVTGESVLWRGTNHCRFVKCPGDKTFT